MTLDAGLSKKRTGSASAAPSPAHHYGRGDFAWRRQSDGAWALHYMGRRNPIVHVIPDTTHAQMWRVRAPDGRVSDAANFTWARDGAIGAALRILNTRPPAS